MEEFLKNVWVSKSWIIATTVLLFCLNEVSSSIAELRQIAQSQVEFSVTVNDIEAELDRENKVVRYYESSITDLKPLLDYLMSYLDSDNEAGKDATATGKTYSDRTYERLKTHYAAMSGIRLACVECREIQKILLAGIERNVQLAHGIGVYFDNPNEIKARNDIVNLHNETMHHNLSLAETVIPAFIKEREKQSVEFVTKTAELHQARNIVYIIIACAIYIVCFIIVALLKYFRHKSDIAKAVKNQELL